MIIAFGKDRLLLELAKLQDEFDLMNDLMRATGVVWSHQVEEQVKRSGKIARLREALRLTGGAK